MYLTVNSYSNAEMIDMYFMYDSADGNALAPHVVYMRKLEREWVRLYGDVKYVSNWKDTRARHREYLL